MQFRKKYFGFVLALLTMLTVSLTHFFNRASGSETKNSTEKEIVTAADNLLNTFSGQQLENIKHDFWDDERSDWHYFPGSREGIPVKDFSEHQKKLLDNLLKLLLSDQGSEKVKGVITLESVLYELSGRSSYRDPAKYYVAFFGSPGNSEPWGIRYEGHHLSLNFSIIPVPDAEGEDRILVSTPMFLGANPAEVKHGEHKGLRVLKQEEDYARELIKSLDKQQFKEALIDEDAPGDIITGNDERVDPLNPKGIPASKLNKNQFDILIKLIQEYIANSDPDQAEQKHFDLFTSDPANIYFAWAGGTEKGQPHCYRIQSNTFHVEYDNTQDDANHIHSVWRSFKNDFGEDLLKKHYQELKH